MMPDVQIYSIRIDIRIDICSDNGVLRQFVFSSANMILGISAI